NPDVAEVDRVRPECQAAASVQPGDPAVRRFVASGLLLRPPWESEYAHRAGHERAASSASHVREPEWGVAYDPVVKPGFRSCWTSTQGSSVTVTCLCTLTPGHTLLCPASATTTWVGVTDVPVIGLSGGKDRCANTIPARVAMPGGRTDPDPGSIQV